MTSTFIFSTISGGYFVSQTAILATILPNITKVDAYFGNSGGAVANLIALKYSGTSESMERVLYSIDKDIFVKPWVSDNMPLSKVLSPFISLFTSSFYKDSKGPKELMEIFYTKEELRKAEMWIGKFDINANFNHLLCSKKSGQSIFNTELSKAYNTKYLEDMTGSFNVEYADGDIDVISDTLNATSSIPGYKPPVTIKETLYVDGGVSSPSPGSAFTNILLDYRADNPAHNIRFFYNIGPKFIDSDIEYVKPSSHWSSQIFRTLKSLLNFSISRERQMMFNTWIQMCKRADDDARYTAAGVTFKKVTGKDALKTYLDTLTGHYFVTCYSIDESINVLNFNKDDLKRVYKKCYDNVFFEIYSI